jgi:peptidoglycan-associated lipoprotein
MRSRTLALSLIGIALASACHSAPPASTPEPQPTDAEVALHRHMEDSLAAVAKASADSAEQARQLALVASARADSVERARVAADATARQLAEQNTALRNELGVMVHFDVARATLRADGMEALDRKVAILNANPSVRLKVTGATDERGSDQYNQALGARRASAVTKYLVSKGIDVARLDGVSSGEKSPVDAGTGESAWALNRRAEFEIMSGDSPLAMMP